MKTAGYKYDNLQLQTQHDVRSDAAVEAGGGEAGLQTDWTDTQTEQAASARG